MSLEREPDWELNKENIIPLIGGRGAEHLVSMNKNDPTINKLNLDYEMKLQFYMNDKPKLLDIFLEYIEWREQTVLTGQGQRELIEKALGMLDQCNELFQNLKYVKIWLKYLTLLDEKEETFQYIISNGIGFGHSLLYITYAQFCELNNNFTRADQVFVLGIERRAEPLKELKHQYSDFLRRLSYKKVENVEGGEGPLRTAFTDIMMEKTGTVAVDRVTNLQIAKPIHNGATPSEQQSAPKFNVFQEQKEKKDAAPGGWNHPLIKSKSDRDNILKPTAWNTAKLKSTVVKKNQSGITIHGVFQDEDCITLSTPRSHLLLPSSLPPMAPKGSKVLWIIATEVECKSNETEYSAEELVSLRYFHIKSSALTHPLKSQLNKRFDAVRKTLRSYVEF